MSILQFHPAQLVWGDTKWEEELGRNTFIRWEWLWRGRVRWDEELSLLSCPHVHHLRPIFSHSVILRYGHYWWKSDLCSYINLGSKHFLTARNVFSIKHCRLHKISVSCTTTHHKLISLSSLNWLGWLWIIQLHCSIMWVHLSLALHSTHLACEQKEIPDLLPW